MVVMHRKSVKHYEPSMNKFYCNNEMIKRGRFKSRHCERSEAISQLIYNEIASVILLSQ
jgi:hypothetical protein